MWLPHGGARDTSAVAYAEDREETPRQFRHDAPAEAGVEQKVEKLVEQLKVFYKLVLSIL